jgi:hypothetical protein
MAANDDPIFDLRAWRRESSDEAFEPILDDIKSKLHSELPHITLKKLRRWRDCYRKQRVSLLTAYPVLEHFSQREPDQPEEQEYALCQAVIPLLELEIDRRGGRERTELHNESPIAESEPDKPSSSSPFVANQPKEDPEVAKRRALVKLNLGLKTGEMCQLFDREKVPLPRKWSEAGFASWEIACKDKHYRGLIQTVISKDKAHS